MRWLLQLTRGAACRLRLRCLSSGSIVRPDAIAVAPRRANGVFINGYDAWWLEWQQQRPRFPSLGVDDILASEGTVVVDANIGAIFARLNLSPEKSTSPDRQVFLGMLRSLVLRGRLNAPPKLMHRYAIATNRGFKLSIPTTEMDDVDRNSIGHMAQQLMQWIIESKFQLPRSAGKSMDFLVTLLQCAFLYESTILLTNNKDYYFLLRAARDFEHAMHESYPEYGHRLDLASVRIVYVFEQLKLNVYQVVRV